MYLVLPGQYLMIYGRKILKVDVQGTNAAIWSLIAIGCYTRAQILGETMPEAKENRGKGGRA